MKKTNGFSFYYKDKSKEIKLDTSSKSAGYAYKLLKEVVPTACQCRKRKKFKYLKMILKILVNFFKIIDLFMHIYFKDLNSVLITRPHIQIKN